MALYPPMIESKLPAQYGNQLFIPFQHSRAVGPSQYTGMRVLIKTASTGEERGRLEINGINLSSPLMVNIDSLSLKPKEYYKIQLAYIVNDTDQTFSSPGIFKYTTIPQIAVTEQDGVINGTFSTEDTGEWVEYYQFDIYLNNTLVESSGKQLCEPYSDTRVNNKYSLECPIELYCSEGVPTERRIEYTVITNNSLEMKVSNPAEDEDPVVVNFKAETVFNASNVDRDNGAIKFENGLAKKYYRKNMNTGKIIAINDQQNQDFTGEQGVPYIYYAQPAKGFAKSNQIVLDFEDMFLADNTHQLRIRFNPKVASFKETVQESKLNTIGGRFPISYRNGNSQYKEFSISGLISYEMDNDELFMKNINQTHAAAVRTSTGFEEAPATESFTPAQQIAAERQFKLKVLEWLNNGQPKLFRSPTEGNYIIRLTNVSLSPNDQLGRMLHSFNASAYEIAEYNSTNLKNYKVTFKGATR